MYGSALRIETRRPGAWSSRPMLAAVMPLPSEEVTPPVTKTYFAMGHVLRGFFECYRKGPPEARLIVPRGGPERRSTGGDGWLRCGRGQGADGGHQGAGE